MTTLLRMSGVAGALLDCENGNITFFVELESGRRLAFIASATVAEQAASTLEGACAQSRRTTGKKVAAKVAAW